MFQDFRLVLAYVEFPKQNKLCYKLGVLLNMLVYKIMFVLFLSYNHMRMNNQIKQLVLI